MKKLRLNLQNIEGSPVLTREQLKKVLGGDDPGSDGGSTRKKCCPKDNCSSAQCSTCVTIPSGSHADCSGNGSNSQVCNC